MSRWEASKKQPTLNPYVENGVVYNSPTKNYTVAPITDTPTKSFIGKRK